MRKYPAISVILPFYNSEKTLERAVSSILVQSFKDFELILVNNNSVDRGNDIATQLAKKDPRIILIEEKRQGVVFASNTGAAIAKGKYISRMDSDDEALPSKLEMQKVFLDLHPDIDAVAGLVEYIPHNDQTDGFSRFVDWSNSVITAEDLCLKRFVELPVVNPTLMWRIRSGYKFGLYRSGDFPEDYEMILRWLDLGARIEKIPELVLKWYDSDKRLTRNHEIYREQAFYSIKSKYLALWLKKHNTFHPNVSVWGASRISRRRASVLEQNEIQIQSYIDTKKSRQIDKKIVFYKEIPPPGELFILVYIKQIEMRDKIRIYLIKKGYEEGINFLLVS